MSSNDLGEKIFYNRETNSTAFFVCYSECLSNPYQDVKSLKFINLDETTTELILYITATTVGEYVTTTTTVGEYVTTTTTVGEYIATTTTVGEYITTTTTVGEYITTASTVGEYITTTSSAFKFPERLTVPPFNPFAGRVDR